MNQTVTHIELHMTLKYAKKQKQCLDKHISTTKKHFEWRNNNTGMVVASICFTQVGKEETGKEPSKKFLSFYLSSSSKNLISPLLILEAIL